MGSLRILLFIFVAAGVVSCSSEKQKRWQWNLKTTVQDYERIGRRDPKWDAPARETLTLFAQWRAGNATDDALAAPIGRACQNAIDAGCKDPLVIYVHARFVVSKTSRPERDIATAHRRAADSFKGSGYSSLRKFYAFLRAGESLYRLTPVSKLEVMELMNDASAALAQAMKEDDAPYGEIYQAARALMFSYPKMKVPRDWGWRKLEPLLRKKWGGSYAERLATNAPQVD